MTRQIPIRRRDGSVRAITLVDEADYERLSSVRWFLDGKGYVTRGVGPRRDHRMVLMHREILGLQPGDGLGTDHINRDKLDNRRENLRIVTHAQNLQNVSKQTRPTTSRFRGVSWARRSGKWVAQAKVGDRRTHLGFFTNEIEAAIAAEAFRREHMPFAQPDPLLAQAIKEEACPGSSSPSESLARS